MPNPACEVKEGAGAYAATTNGVDVTPGNTVTIHLIDTSADTWSIECAYTDDTSDAATVTAALTIDSNARTATFTAPAAGKAYIFRSRVNNGVGPDGRTVSSYTTTFGVYTLVSGNRVMAASETTEGDATFGWVTKFNDFIRAGGVTGGIVLANASTGTLDDIVTTDSGSSVTAIRFSGVAPTADGFDSGSDGRRLIVMTTGGPLVLANEAAGSVAANRIVTGTGAAVTIQSGGGALLIYDGTSSRWRLAGANGSGGSSAGNAAEVQTSDGAGGFTAATNVKAGPGYIGFGGTPASAAHLRLPNAAAMVAARDAANAADLVALASNASGELFVGTDSAYTAAQQWQNIRIYAKSAGAVYVGTASGTYLSITSSLVSAALDMEIGGGTVASAGTIRMKNASAVKVRNAANSADLCVFATDASDQLFLGVKDGTWAERFAYVYLSPSTSGHLNIGGSGASALVWNTASVSFGLPRHGYGTPYGSEGRYTQAMADANQTLTNTQYTKAIIKATGAITAARTLTFPHPASEDESYMKWIVNACTGAFNLVISTGTGTTVNMASGTSAPMLFTPNGVEFGYA